LELELDWAMAVPAQRSAVARTVVRLRIKVRWVRPILL